MALRLLLMMMIMLLLLTLLMLMRLLSMLLILLVRLPGTHGHDLAQEETMSAPSVASATPMPFYRSLSFSRLVLLLFPPHPRDATAILNVCADACGVALARDWFEGGCPLLFHARRRGMGRVASGGDFCSRPRGCTNFCTRSLTHSLSRRFCSWTTMAKLRGTVHFFSLAVGGSALWRWSFKWRGEITSPLLEAGMVLR